MREPPLTLQSGDPGMTQHVPSLTLVHPPLVARCRMHFPPLGHVSVHLTRVEPVHSPPPTIGTPASAAVAGFQYVMPSHPHTGSRVLLGFGRDLHVPYRTPHGTSQNLSTSQVTEPLVQPTLPSVEMASLPEMASPNPPSPGASPVASPGAPSAPGAVSPADESSRFALSVLLAESVEASSPPGPGATWNDADEQATDPDERRKARNWIEKILLRIA